MRDSGFDRHWLTHTAIAVVALTMLSTIFYSFGWFAAFETASLDFALRNARFTEVDDVRLVEITDEDYSKEDLFDSTMVRTTFRSFGRKRASLRTKASSSSEMRCPVHFPESRRSR